MNEFWFFGRILTITYVQEYVLQPERIKVLPCNPHFNFWHLEKDESFDLAHLNVSWLPLDSVLLSVRFWVPRQHWGYARCVLHMPFIFYSGPKYTLSASSTISPFIRGINQLLSYITYSLQKHFLISCTDKEIWWGNLGENCLKTQYKKNTGHEENIWRKHIESY